jgi:hypothetical protein
MKKAKLPLSEIPASHLPIIVDLPASIYRNIGKIISAHAFLETQLFELLFELSRIDYSIGRVIFKYQSASDLFKLVRRLLILHGVSTAISFRPILKRIEQCCKTRDSFAHGVWVLNKNGSIALRLAKGEYEIPAGRADRSFVPEVSSYSADFCERARREALEIGFIMKDLREEIGEKLAKRNAKSE